MPRTISASACVATRVNSGSRPPAQWRAPLVRSPLATSGAASGGEKVIWLPALLLDEDHPDADVAIALCLARRVPCSHCMLAGSRIVTCWMI